MATKRTVQHVAPDSSAKAWLVSREEDERLRESYQTKDGAVEAAKQRARRQVPAQVKVHTSDGNVEYESTYGDDPTRYPADRLATCPAAGLSGKIIYEATCPLSATGDRRLAN
jgi:hypothetical protein